MNPKNAGSGDLMTNVVSFKDGIHERQQRLRFVVQFDSLLLSRAL